MHLHLFSEDNKYVFQRMQSFSVSFVVLLIIPELPTCTTLHGCSPCGDNNSKNSHMIRHTGIVFSLSCTVLLFVCMTKTISSMLHTLITKSFWMSELCVWSFKTTEMNYPSWQACISACL